MKYQYSTAYDLANPTAPHKRRPVLEIELFGPKNKVSIFGALVDSGADVSVLNIGVAEILGLDLSKAERQRTIGISGGQETLVSTIQIRVEGQDQRITIPVRFIDSQYVDALLGQEGFFDHYRIKFEKDHDTFEITPAKKK